MFYFYTVTTPEQSYLCDNLKKSLHRFGCELTILPLYNRTNFSKLNINYVFQTTDYADDDIIVVCDGFDVVCCNDPVRIEAYLTSHDVDILISSENMFGNNLVAIKEYYDRYNQRCGTVGKYLNAGVIAGRANKVKQFYNDVFTSVETLQRYIPTERRETTGDQAYIINYLYHNDILGKEIVPYKVKIDMKDELFFTNTITEREYQINDYVFIHTWGIYIQDPNYKYIRDQQYKKWVDINTQLKID